MTAVNFDFYDEKTHWLTAATVTPDMARHAALTVADQVEAGRLADEAEVDVALQMLGLKPTPRDDVKPKRAPLTAAERLAIRRARHEDGRTFAAIAAEHGISETWAKQLCRETRAS